MSNEKLHHLLAVDVGLHTGLALFSENAELLWYRSHHLSSPAKLKKVIGKLLREQPRPTHVLLEGGGPLAELWITEADKLSIETTQIHAQQWRNRLFYSRQHRSGSQAKREADGLARQVIEQLGGKKPTSLRHDTAEAILIGLFGLLELGWLVQWPIKKD
ncbi:hypothetical protein SAMN02745165_03038 [Malonomonas rubra DSM 5091]|uniref:Uncharacterized protein n=1 Tax=Malonomonas rubra DSM 5091 TaxID=1122189 RepID=A0A1M6LPR9_MALRU|nr:hypothetical protein [Malonomonas rubra]SHJ73181.1 hypothetical protein SAMN02745165_03038 [Malonomonas rubra DSM 5091]